MLNTKQSFFQEGKSFNSFIKSEYLYFSKDSEFYKESSKDKSIIPKNIIEIIHSKLKSNELKNILEAYNGIKNTNIQEYIIFSKNTLYMLCAPRLNIDEESIFNNIFHKDLSHIYKFYSSIRDKMKELSARQITDSIAQYRISTLFFNMISKSYIFAILQDTNSDFHKNAKAFIPYDEKTEDDKKDFKLRFLFIKEPKFTKQILEKVKEVELISKAVEDILDEIIKNEDNLKYKDSVNRYLKSLKTFSSTIAFLRIIDFTLMDSRDFKDFSQFANDIISLTIYTTNFLKQKNILDKNTLANFIKQINKEKKTLFINLSITNRFNIVFIIINSIVDSKKLYKNDDYDALAVQSLISILTISIIFIPPSIPSRIVIALIELSLSLVYNYFVDSDFLVFLKRTILAKNISTSNVLFNDNKVYSAYFLANSFKNNKDIDVGFKSDKALIDFIGTNYYSYKENFELAFKNELQFLYTNLVGLKLEKIKYISEKSKNEFIIDSRKVYLDIKEAILIPNALIEDEKFVLTFDGTNYLKDDLTNNNIFNPFKDDTIISNFVFRNIFKYSSNLSISTSSVELNYSITYNIKKNADFSSTKIYIDINKIEQIEFDN
ncbi:hypothetical protein [Aliarcobacter thereius]|uniref:hypothetical protein n=1 Tax=Aliarcobacter thereius TaxID=544718 RepID=UPI0013F4C468|nr:hypothetical protein [Aliarcobacter thereius]